MKGGSSLGWWHAALVGLACVAVAAHGAGAVTSPTSGAAVRPRMVVKLIPFGAKRRAETAGYAKRHYGTESWRLDHPQLRNVIGHNESPSNPYHHELYPGWRCQTHGDWNHADMEVYRSELRRPAVRASVPLGPIAQPRHSGCK